MANNSNKEEPSTAPKPNRWYNISLGSTFKDQNQPSSKFCTLRYEFKPASIDKSQPGSFHKTKDNRVKVEFENNQHGKPKVTFEGSCEDYKDNDAVLFFDGGSFRLERLHRAVKRLRHVRQPGESAAAASMASTGPASESYSPPGPPLGKGMKPESSNKAPVPAAPLQVERIDTGDFEIGDNQSHIVESRKQNNSEQPSSIPNKPSASPDPKNYESEGQVDILDDDEDNDILGTDKQDEASEKVAAGFGIDINLPHQFETDEEIADVDLSEDEDKAGHSAAEALRAQVNAEGKEQSSSSSSSSGSESSSSSSSSDSESSDGDTVISI